MTAGTRIGNPSVSATICGQSAPLAAPPVSTACGGEKKPWDLDWHHAGGFGRVTIDVLGIELGEATPSAELIEALEQSGASGWDYYYYA